MAALIGGISTAVRSILNALGYIATIAIWGLSIAISIGCFFSGAMTVLGAKNLKDKDVGLSVFAAIAVISFVFGASLSTLHPKVKTILTIIVTAIAFLGFFGQNYANAIKAFKPFFASADPSLWTAFFASGALYATLFLLSKLKR